VFSRVRDGYTTGTSCSKDADLQVLSDALPYVSFGVTGEVEAREVGVDALGPDSG
jgi:hypothetical protein